MSENMTVSPAYIGVTSAAAGGLIGYLAAPRKFNLEQLLTEKPDVFEKTFSQEVLKSASEPQKESVKNLTTTRKTIEALTDPEALKAELKTLTKSEKMIADYKNIKGLIPRARLYAAVLGAVVAGFIGIFTQIIFAKDKSAPQKKS